MDTQSGNNTEGIGSTDYPKIAVIVPAFNEEKHIAKCLDSLISQSYPGIVEIIVVDGRSFDNTRNIVEKYRSENENVILLENQDRILDF